MAAKIFLSYRREDTAGYAGRIQERLAKQFGQVTLFIDVDAIPLGANYPEVLLEEVGKCEVFIALMGERWREALADKTNRGLVDFFRLEIATALHGSDVRVIPIFLDDAKAPEAKDLPEDIRDLAQKNGHRIRHDAFDDDMNRLIKKLKEELPGLRKAAEDLMREQTVRDIKELGLLDDIRKPRK
jgi:TIR domain